MFDDTQDFYDYLVEEAGELMVVLDSDREYDCHTHDTEVVEAPNGDEVIQTEGVPSSGGEYQIVTFDVDSIEHVYVHKEN